MDEKFLEYLNELENDFDESEDFEDEMQYEKYLQVKLAQDEAYKRYAEAKSNYYNNSRKVSEAEADELFRIKEYYEGATYNFPKYQAYYVVDGVRKYNAPKYGVKGDFNPIQELYDLSKTFTGYYSGNVYLLRYINYDEDIVAKYSAKIYSKNNGKLKLLWQDDDLDLPKVINFPFNF